MHKVFPCWKLCLWSALHGRKGIKSWTVLNMSSDFRAAGLKLMVVWKSYANVSLTRRHSAPVGFPYYKSFQCNVAANEESSLGVAKAITELCQGEKALAKYKVHLSIGCWLLERKSRGPQTHTSPLSTFLAAKKEPTRANFTQTRFLCVR